MLGKILGWAKALLDAESYELALKKLAHAMDVLESKGCQFEDWSMPEKPRIQIRVPRNGLGIKAWGMVDLFVRVGGGKINYIVDDIPAKNKPILIKTRKVLDVKAQKLELRRKLAQKRPHKYAVAR